MEHRILKARKQLLWEPLRTVGKNRASCGPHCPWSNYMERSASNGSSRSSGEREKRGSGALAATESSAHEPRRKRREVARRSWNKEDDFLPWPVRERRRGNEKDLPSIFPDEGQRKGKKNGDRELVMLRVRFGLASTPASATRRPWTEPTGTPARSSLTCKENFLRDNVWNNVFNPI